VLVIIILLTSLYQGGAACASVDDCRQQAVDAAARGDYETFHDLAWRAVQKAKPNDPELMYLLARAQSLSGRPGDALVMLQRLKQLGITTDAATNDDFRRVRALKDWPEFAESTSSAPAAAPKPASASPAAAARPTAPAEPRSSADAFTFDAPSEFEPVGLDYDAVSRRFLVGDRAAGRLIVIDEVSHHLVTLVSAASADFLNRISGFAIDPKRGDLWVASTDGQESALHKLQLISGRVLTSVLTRKGGKPTRFEDVAVDPDGTVFAVDGAAGAIFRLRPGAKQFEIAQEIGSDGGRTLTLAGGNTFYVGGGPGVLRVDAGRTAKLKTPKGAVLSNIGRLRWHDGSLIALQETSSGPRVLRLKLDDAGKAIARVEVLDERAASATAGTLTERAFFYLGQGGTIRSIPVR
jgi:hypothetical protein